MGRGRERERERTEREQRERGENKARQADKACAFHSHTFFFLYSVIIRQQLMQSIATPTQDECDTYNILEYE